MRALTYHGAEDVRVETVADPIIQEPDDIILKSQRLNMVISLGMNLWVLSKK